MIEEKTINLGESGSTARMTMLPVARGASGLGVFTFTGEGRLPVRPHKEIIDIINKEAVKQMTTQGTCPSFAIPANKDYHMPIKLYVGREALRQLEREIESGQYEYFRHALFV